MPLSRAWFLCGLMFLASALSFLDRQVLSVLAPVLTAEFSMSNAVYSRVVFAFVLSYTVMFTVGGRLMDRLGTRLGLAFSVGLWSLASAAHGWVAGPWGLGIARFFLGAGEGACFPAAAKGVVEWMPEERRALAMGVATGGSAFGAVMAPPLTAWGAALFGWRGAFMATALLGLLWLLAWQAAFHGRSEGRETVALRETSRIRELIAQAEVRRLLLARFFFDPVFYFYMFWIPQYLSWERGLDLAEIGALSWIPFFVLGLVQIAGGRLSDRLVSGGWEPRRARIALMLLAAMLTPASWLATRASTAGLAIGLMSVLMLAHGIWISNFMTLIGDLVPSRDVGTVVGLTGTCGGAAGMISNLLIGPVADGYSFVPVFAATAILYPLAWLILAGRPGLAVLFGKGANR